VHRLIATRSSPTLEASIERGSLKLSTKVRAIPISHQKDTLEALRRRTSDMRKVINRHFHESQDVLERALASPDFVDIIMLSAQRITESMRGGGKVLIAGNGGSAADAQHIAGEFVSRLNFDRGPLPAVALTTDSSVLTAIGNDYGFEQVFERQVRGFGRPGDVLLAVSTSGRSPNILRALEAAREMEMVSIGFTGMRGIGMAALCDLVLVAPSEVTQLIQQVHITAAHAVCELVEAAIFDGSRSSISEPISLSRTNRAAS
jgi:D-sedoheptulose 7-phosphate isomerase